MSLKIDELFSVRGKVALVTGGSSGIGRMIAQGLCQNGVKVYIASRKLDLCEVVAAELSEYGECIPIGTNLGEQDSLAALAADVAAREPKLHILVNNAGAGWAQPIEDYPESGWDKVMTLNVKSPFFLTKALLPQLRAAGSKADPARVINIGSISGLHSRDVDNFAYGASKAALHHVSRTLARTLADENILVNAVAPGPFPSRMMGDQLPAYVEHVPLGRGGAAEDIAGTVIYLCSRAGAYLSGVVLPLDGGTVA
ncbi:MAG: short-chain dehydrogenase/reductase [Phenylobacterium sp.]|nr:short-chain dehydrogenase/reductase [Phenylobacterium sp.]